VEEFRRRGHAHLPGVFSQEEMVERRPSLRDYVMGVWRNMTPSERSSGASATQTNFSLGNAPAEVVSFVTSPRLGELAARFLGVESVRVLHFCGFFKPGGGAATPWHQDLQYMPLDTEKVLSIWIPLTDVTPDMGSLIFADGSHLQGALDTSSANGRFSVARNGLMRAGDASMHMGWTLHGALRNTSQRMREAITIGYYADGARIRVNRAAPPIMRNFLDSYFPGLGPGDLAAGPLTPVVFCRQPA
jgi:Phytanoyl-CoA dioxygenase (PhyH)